jgi:hypothetical protein
MRVRLDFERRGWHQDFYTLLPLDTNGRLAELDAKMERLRKQHIECSLLLRRRCEAVCSTGCLIVNNCGNQPCPLYQKKWQYSYVIIEIAT